MGDDESDACFIEVTTDMILGDADASMFVIDASTVLNKCAWDAGLFYSLDGGGSGIQLTVLNGYHGSPRDDQHGVQEVGDYAYYARDDGAGDDWVDIMHTVHSGSDNDDCAVSIVFSEDETEADDAFYNAGLADYHSTGVHTGSTYYYIDGCDSVSGPEL